MGKMKDSIHHTYARLYFFCVVVILSSIKLLSVGAVQIL